MKAVITLKTLLFAGRFWNEELIKEEDTKTEINNTEAAGKLAIHCLDEISRNSDIPIIHRVPKKNPFHPSGLK